MFAISQLCFSFFWLFIIFIFQTFYVRFLPLQFWHQTLSFLTQAGADIVISSFVVLVMFCPLKCPKELHRSKAKHAGAKGLGGARSTNDRFVFSLPLVELTCCSYGKL